MSLPLTRREFVASVAGAAAALRAHPAGRGGGEGAGGGRVRLLRVAVLSEPGFPTLDASPLSSATLGEALDGMSVEYLAPDALAQRLTSPPDRYDVFLNPYGSAFPKDAWPALHAFLAAGGNWVNAGGAPCAVPVSGSGGSWTAEPRQADWQRRLGIVLACAVDVSPVREWRANAAVAWAAPLAEGIEARTVWEPYYRLSSVADTPDESGSAGPREAVVQPLVWALGAGGRPVAAPYVCVDRLEREFAGGRWIFATLDGPVSPRSLRALVEAAALGPELFEVRPSFACYRAGERPAVQATWRGRRRESAGQPPACRVAVFDERGAAVGSAEVTLSGSRAEASGGADLASLPAHLAPGLYRVEAVLTLPADPPREVPSTTGFWVWDEALLAGGEPLVAGDPAFRRGGEPFPVTGTTYMASDVHRKFLLQPNPWIWDRDFGAMKGAGVNLVRTGIWTGWRALMSEPGRFDEAALRALDAWLLTARRHDIPVIFTLFAFLPEAWGGENPYLAPRALEAQRGFVTAIARRYRRMKDLAWDLINEPSFCNKDHLWSCRPNYDGFERAAWTAWVRERRVAGPDGAPPDLPSLDDFKEEAGGSADDARALRVLEYRLFAQAQFQRWARFMRGVLRATSPHQLLTVGQDEAGTRDSPNNLFLAPDLDFTCVHTWWLNDALAWDEVMTKAPAKANLVEETGVMFSGRPAGVEPRWEAYARDLLERKMALALGVGGGAGFVEWVWNSNCYMPSDNEAAIGFLRADGTAKPELEAFVGVAAFAAAARRHLVGRLPEPVLLVVPHSVMFSTRDTATGATKEAVRLLLYGCRVGVSAVSEYALAPGMVAPPPRPRLVVVPGDELRRPEARAALAAWRRRGTVVLTGPVDEARYRRGLDDAGIRPAFDVQGADASVLVHGAPYRDAELYVLASEGEREVTLRITPVRSGVPFEARVAPGRAALWLVGRDGRVLARYPAG